MEGFDVLGAVEFEEYIVGAVIPDEKPVVRKLTRASSKASTVAAKLARLNSPKAKAAAQKLRAHASAATTKGQKLSKAVQQARTKAQATLAKPAAKPFVAQAAARAAQYAAHTAPASRTSVPARIPAGSPARSMQSPRATAPASSVRRGASLVPSKGMSVLGLSGFQLQAAANWVGPMLDVYAAFANAIDDASVAGEVWDQVGPLVDQLSASNPSHPLVSDGNALLQRANDIIDSPAPPPDPPLVEGVNLYSGVGWALIGDVSSAAMSLQVDAIAWIKQARLALGQWGTPAATTQPGAPPAPPVSPVTSEMPPMNQSGGGSGGGGGGSSGGGEGGGEEGAAPADESGMPPEGGEEGGEEGAYAEEGGDYSEEGEEEYYATQGGGAGVQGVTDEYGDYEEDAEYASDEGEYGDESSADAYGDEEQSTDESSEGEEGGEMTALEALSLIGRGGGHGGGGHGGGHGHGGHHRGMRGGWGPWYGGPWYDGYGYDVLLEDDDEELADKIAKKVAQKQWATGRAHVGYVAPETHWYTIATPGAIKAEMDKILHEGETLAQDIASYRGGATSFSAFKAGWDSFWAGYKKFYEDTGWFGRLTSSAGDQVVAYGNQLNDWRNKLKQFGGAIVTEPSATAIVRREDPTKFNYMPLVYGGIAVVALVGGGYALSHVSAIAALFSRKKTA